MWFPSLSLLLLWLPVLTALTFLALRWVRRRRSYLYGADAVFVSGDVHRLVVVHAIATTKTRMTHAQLRACIEQHFACHRRFRQRIVTRAWRWHYFEDDAEFKVEHHLRVHQLPQLPAEEATPVALQRQLESYVSSLIQTPIDFSRAPWEFVLIEQYGAGSALVMRVHHSIADGITLMRLSMHAFQSADQGPGAGASPELVSPGLNQSPSPAPGGEATKQSARIRRSPSPRPRSSSSAASLIPDGGFRALHKFKKPRASPPKSLWAKGSAVLYQVYRAVATRPDKPSVFRPTSNITPSVPCNARWLDESLSLAELKQLSYATGTSVNDVLFCIVASSMRRYCIRRNQPPESMHDINCVMWMSLQGTDARKEVSFGNKIGAVYLTLPMREGDELQRLMRVRDLTAAMQVSPEPYVMKTLMELAGLLPMRITAALWDFLAYKATCSMSNVPGPQHPVVFAGAELDRLVFFVPPQGTIASFLTILSYAGRVQMGCLVDSRVVEEPRELVQLFVAEFEALKAQVSKEQQAGTLQRTLGLAERDRVY